MKLYDASPNSPFSYRESSFLAEMDFKSLRPHGLPRSSGPVGMLV